MSIKQKLELVKELKETSDEVIKMMDSYGSMTGSSLWGLQSKESDIDMIIHPESNVTWEDVMQNHNGIYLHKDEEYNIAHYNGNDCMSLYILYNNEIYNLLFMNSVGAYNKWIYASQKMSEKIKKEPSFKEKLKDRNYRIEYFNILKDEFKGGN